MYSALLQLSIDMQQWNHENMRMKISGSLIASFSNSTAVFERSFMCVNASG